MPTLHPCQYTLVSALVAFGTDCADTIVQVPLKRIPLLIAGTFEHDHGEPSQHGDIAPGRAPELGLPMTPASLYVRMRGLRL